MKKSNINTAFFFIMLCLLFLSLPTYSDELKAGKNWIENGSLKVEVSETSSRYDSKAIRINLFARDYRNGHWCHLWSIWDSSRIKGRRLGKNEDVKTEKTQKVVK